MVLCGISWSAVFEQRYDRLYELLDKAHILRDDFARTVHLLNHRQLFLIGRPHSFGKYDFDRIGAVSYTHLDVYKRQDLNNPPNPQYINLLFGNKNQSTPNNPQIICIILPLRRTWSLQR